MSTASTYAAALQGREPSRRPTAARGRRHVGAYVPPDVARQLRVRAPRGHSSTQALIVRPAPVLRSQQDRDSGPYPSRD